MEYFSEKAVRRTTKTKGKNLGRGKGWYVFSVVSKDQKEWTALRWTANLMNLKESERKGRWVEWVGVKRDSVRKA